IGRPTPTSSPAHPTGFLDEITAVWVSAAPSSSEPSRRVLRTARARPSPTSGRYGSRSGATSRPTVTAPVTMTAIRVTVPTAKTTATTMHVAETAKVTASHGELGAAWWRGRSGMTSSPGTSTDAQSVQVPGFLNRVAQRGQTNGWVRAGEATPATVRLDAAGSEQVRGFPATRGPRHRPAGEGRVSR